MSALAAPPQTSRPVAWWGMVMVVASESTLFGALIGTYFFLRFSSVQWPPDGLARPGITVPIVLSLTLAAAVGPMRLASRAANAGRVALARAFVLLALVVQSGYFAYEVHDFQRSLHVFTPQTDAYGSIYYVLLGADHAHVAVGLLLDVWLLGKLAGGLTGYRIRALRVVALYWTAVAVLTLCVTGTLLSAAA